MLNSVAIKPDGRGQCNEFQNWSLATGMCLKKLSYPGLLKFIHFLLVFQGFCIRKKCYSSIVSNKDITLLKLLKESIFFIVVHTLIHISDK